MVYYAAILLYCVSFWVLDRENATKKPTTLPQMRQGLFCCQERSYTKIS